MQNTWQHIRQPRAAERRLEMKVNRPINECHCWNCKHFQECEDKGVFDDFDGFDFCCNYEDIDYQDNENE